MAKKKKPAIPILRNQIQVAMKELDGIEKDLAKVQATLERYLNQPNLSGEEEYLADLRTLLRKRR
jgi:replication fork clamp-binding protein CrfC